MKKIIYSLTFLTGLGLTSAQVKIGANPTTIGNGQLLELSAQGTRAGMRLAQVALTSSTDITTVGIPASAVGTLVYNTGTGALSTPGVYVWSGSSWELQSSQSALTVGDIKTGIQTGDHSGWIKLDGRALSSLTTTQQARAITLGLSGNLPNASNSQLTQNGLILGSVSGNNTKNIAQSQLPNVSISGNTSTSGSHSHSLSGGNFIGDGAGGSASNVTFGGASYRAYSGTALSGSHTHTLTTDSINGGVTQQAFDVRGQQLSVNMFIYLGN